MRCWCFFVGFVQEPCQRCALFVKLTEGEASDGVVVDSKVEGDEDEEEHVSGPEGSDERNDETAELNSRYYEPNVEQG